MGMLLILEWTLCQLRDSSLADAIPPLLLSVCDSFVGVCFRLRANRVGAGTADVADELRELADRVFW